MTVFSDIFAIQVEKLLIFFNANFFLHNFFNLKNRNFGRKLDFEGFAIVGVQINLDRIARIFLVVMGHLRRKGYSDFTV